MQEATKLYIHLTITAYTYRNPQGNKLKSIALGIERWMRQCP